MPSCTHLSHPEESVYFCGSSRHAGLLGGYPFGHNRKWCSAQHHQAFWSPHSDTCVNRNGPDSTSFQVNIIGWTEYNQFAWGGTLTSAEQSWCRITYPSGGQTSHLPHLWTSFPEPELCSCSGHADTVSTCCCHCICSLQVHMFDKLTSVTTHSQQFFAYHLQPKNSLDIAVTNIRTETFMKSYEFYACGAVSRQQKAQVPMHGNNPRRGASQTRASVDMVQGPVLWLPINLKMSFRPSFTCKQKWTCCNQSQSALE